MLISLKFKKVIFTSISILSLFGYGYFAFAVAPVGGYEPGVELDPDCAPGDTDCIVKTITADNGLTATGSNVQLGGTLLQNTVINQDGNDFLVRDGDYFFGKVSNVSTVLPFPASDPFLGSAYLNTGTGDYFLDGFLNSASGRYTAALSKNGFTHTMTIDGNNDGFNFFTSETDNGSNVRFGTLNIQLKNTNNLLSEYQSIEVVSSGIVFGSELGSYAFPRTAGLVNQVLTTDGTGQLSWQNAGGSNWSLTGNAGTTAGTNFIGTTDAEDFMIKTNGNQIALFGQNGNFAMGSAATFVADSLYTGWPEVSAPDPTASGLAAIALGTGANASGISSLALGTATDASGNAGTAIGFGATASGIFSMAFAGGEASGNGAISIGGTASGEAAFALSGEASGERAKSFGGTAIGNDSYAFGFAGAESVGAASFALCNADCQALGSRSIAIGHTPVAYSMAEIALGFGNTAYTPVSDTSFESADRLFVIGKGGNDAFTILKNGEVGIGINNFEANTNGNMFQVGDGGSTIVGHIDDVTGNWIAVSDERKKDNIADLSYGLDELLQLRATSFNYKRNGEHTIGFIAQQVLPIIPEAVYGTDQEGYGMSYATLTPVIVKAIQEMNLQITEISVMEKSNSWRDALITWFANATNGITDLFTKRIHTEELCVGTVCVTEDQFLQMINNSGSIPVEYNDAPIVVPTTDSNDDVDNNETEVVDETVDTELPGGNEENNEIIENNNPAELTEPEPEPQNEEVSTESVDPVQESSPEPAPTIE